MTTRAAETKWLYDDPTLSYHDADCQCSRHCLNCRTALEGRQRKYCSASCGRRWRTEIEFDQHMRSQVSAS